MAKKKTEKKTDTLAMSVYAKSKAERYNGKFEKKNGKVLRKYSVCVDSWVEKENEAFASSGIFYTKNDAATKKYLAGDNYKS